MSNDNKYNYYYLLYKINRSPLLWIVDESINYNELYEKVNNFFSNKENYTIVKKLYTEEQINDIYNTKFKRFRNFTIDKQCKLVFRTD
jgi:dihydroneopterin aldolase